MMKFIRQVCQWVALLFITVMFNACSDSKVDMMQAEEMKGLDMVGQITQENNPSPSEIEALRAEAPKFQQAIAFLVTVRRDQLSSSQLQTKNELETKTGILGLSRRAAPYFRILMPF